ncbi:hypothetical protein BH11PSE8_BH11PSE8_43120 [soil metagenome]
MPHAEPPVHQIVGFLAEFAPDRRAQLHRASPGEAALRPHLHSGDDLDDTAALAGLIDQANTLAGRLYTLMKQTGATVARPVFRPAAATGAEAAS